MLLVLTQHLRRNLVGYLALFVAVGGTSYAATSLPDGSVGTRQLKDGAVTAAKVRNHSLLARDFASGQLLVGPRGAAGAHGLPGATGAQGSPGATGAQGPKGDKGDTGVPGAAGKTVLNGPGAPDPTVGSDGDFYINTSANTIYGPKSTGSWGGPTSLVGPSGTTNRSIHVGTAMIAAGANGTATVTCPSGSTATGGGFSQTGGLDIQQSLPTNDGTQSWEIDAHNPTGIGGEIVATVVCVSP
jgi:hypothetical protein